MVERGVHWTVAITFTTLAITGLILTFGKNVLLPLIGYTLFSWLAILSKNLHNFVGPLLVVLLPVMILLFVHENLFRRYDWYWLKKGGGMLTGEHVPSGKANAGQKILFWVMVVAAAVSRSCVTGLILDFPNFNQTRADDAGGQRRAHGRGAASPACLLAGHIYLGTIGMKGALRSDDARATSTRRGRSEHHEYWYNEVKSGRGAARGRRPPPRIASRDGNGTAALPGGRRREDDEDDASAGSARHWWWRRSASRWRSCRRRRP